MPLYEYHCADCDTTFETLRSMSKANEPIPCRNCSSSATSRLFSVFAAFSRSNDGQRRTVAGTCRDCAGCGTRNCSSCSHH
jgi:putative FmdB family regulatory protein